MFQSSPSPETGRYQFPRLSSHAIATVPILAQPGDWGATRGCMYRVV
ncbi:MAG: hypothetical protein HC916_19850, partial [Coleofasciculaceae cyanobacterium SM2_1_6]|nr:hypothetical protein [Coleofasciculaceae cyanobacterium SM2_1_6]